ncbi:MAG: ATP-binding protein [Planctomycetota bacterium]|nr:ATP-binding protein [Planctomycetota bacterium]
MSDIDSSTRTAPPLPEVRFRSRPWFQWILWIGTPALISVVFSEFLQELNQIHIRREGVDLIADNPWIFTLATTLPFFFAVLLLLERQRRALSQIQILTEVADAYSRGDFSKRAPLRGHREEAHLGQALNNLADEIQLQIETLRIEHNRMRVIIGGMKDGLLAIDKQERIILLNSVASRLLQAEMRSSKEQKIGLAIQSKEVCSILLETLENQRPDSTKFEVESADGIHTVIAYTSPLLDSNQDPTGALAVLHDVTEVERLESIRKDFVSNVSHELKTPITAIRGLAETIQEDQEMPPETRNQFISRISDQSMRLSLLVTDLLALARLDEKSGKHRFIPLDLRTVTQERITTLSQLGSPGSQPIILPDLGCEALMVFGEEEELRQAIGNLIDNAIKYTKSSGKIEINGTIEEQQACIYIKDNGIGISPEHLDRIFERFYRVDKARSREIGGTGLGLAIVKNICLKHSGDVSVVSSEGSGSCFKLTIPLHSPNNQT